MVSLVSPHQSLQTKTQPSVDVRATKSSVQQCRGGGGKLLVTVLLLVRNIESSCT